jgi:hypothetical protein
LEPRIQKVIINTAAEKVSMEGKITLGPKHVLLKNNSFKVTLLLVIVGTLLTFLTLLSSLPTHPTYPNSLTNSNNPTQLLTLLTLVVSHSLTQSTHYFKGGKPEMMTVSEEQSKGMMKRPDVEKGKAAAGAMAGATSTAASSKPSKAASTATSMDTSTDKRSRPKYKIVESGNTRTHTRILYVVHLLNTTSI